MANTATAEPLAVDPAQEAHEGDADSGIGDDETTYTQTLRSSILESVKENGRSYHKYHDGSYIMPDDAQEQERLDVQHEMYLRTLGRKLILAPIEKEILEHVLDLGTGTGLWAIQFADEHPESSVVGTDLSPIQPSLVPSNCKFEVDDFDTEWTWPHQFDLIHGRMLDCCYADGKQFVQRAYEALRPGGWFELQDATMPIRADDGTMDGTAYEQWVKHFVEAMSKIGRDSLAPEKYEQWMKECGAINVTRIDFKWPQNAWPKDPALKELGKWHMVNTLDGLHGFTMRPFTGILGMKPEEVELLLMQVRKDIQNRRIHSYWPIIVVYGQKPMDSIPPA